MSVNSLEIDYCKLPRIWVKNKVEIISLLNMGIVKIMTFTGNTHLKQRELCPERLHVGGGGDIKHMGLFSPYDQLHDDF